MNNSPEDRPYLLIDDDPVVIKLASGILTAAGYESSTAPTRQRPGDGDERGCEPHCP